MCIYALFSAKFIHESLLKEKPMTYEFSDHQTINAPGGLLNFIL